MRVNILLALLLLLLTLLTGVGSQKVKDIHVKAGEMVQLQCPRYRGSAYSDESLIWTSETMQGVDLTAHTSSAERRQMGVLLHGRSLVILSAYVNHQGNYSCSLRNASRQSRFRLIVHTETREYNKKSTYPMRCYTEESCTLTCPSENSPVNVPNITSQGIIWHKECESVKKVCYFSRVQETDQGLYTCTRSYLYDGHLYNMTFAVELSVEPSKKVMGSASINSPRMNEVFVVDLGSTVVIDCKAVMYSDTDEVFWLRGESFVNKNTNLPVFYNYTRESSNDELTMTASLVFREVSEEDLSKNYTCKLETENEPSSFVTITLTKRDGKTYDVFLMNFKSVTNTGLNEDERNWLRNSLEENYSVRLHEHNISPEKAVTETVLNCIKQSRAMVLVPTSQDLGPGPELPWSAIHEALGARQTGLILIKTDEAATSGSMEVLQHCCKAVNCVTWKGVQDSAFLKQLSFYLPTPQQTLKTRLAP